jgi:hypothetical protein
MTQIKNSDDELIRLYGEFIMRFENICSHLRFTILELLFKQYSQQEFRKVEILLEGITADSLRKKTTSLIIEEYGSVPEILNLSKEVYKEFEKMIPLRNSFAHGTSLINKFTLFKEFDEGYLTLKHPKLKSEGFDFNFLTYDVDKLKALVVKMQYLGNAVELVYFVIKAQRDGNEDKKSVFLNLLRQNVTNAKET